MLVDVNEENKDEANRREEGTTEIAGAWRRPWARLLPARGVVRRPEAGPHHALLTGAPGRYPGVLSHRGEPGERGRLGCTWTTARIDNAAI